MLKKPTSIPTLTRSGTESHSPKSKVADPSSALRAPQNMSDRSCYNILLTQNFI